MTAIWDVLERFYPEPKPGHAGGEESTRPDLGQLRSELRKILRGNTGYFQLAVGLTAVLFAGMISVPFWVGNETMAGLVLTAFGASAFVLVKWMHSLWRDKLLLEILVESNIRLGVDDLRGLINTIREVWLRGQRASPAEGSKGQEGK